MEQVRAGLRASVAHVSHEPRALVPALVVGDTSAMPAGLVERFRVTGLTHLTAVSGANLTLLLAFLGTLAVPLTYALARRMFGPAVGLTAAALLAVSFWGLMYSRVGIRHVMTPTLALAAFYFFWQSLGLAAGERGSRGAGVQKAAPSLLGQAQSAHPQMRPAVPYTHLTLPTIYSV